MANNGVDSTETLNAAANAIGSVDSRNLVAEQKRRWKGCWSGFWCFGSQKQGKRIVPASRIPEGNTPLNGVQQADGTNQPTTLSLSLLAPPSSPASFLNSGNPSAVQSPAGLFSLPAMSASVYSPGPPTSTMFAIGPYAHETQPVSPPVFSSFTTEPSTAPFTPPPELVHLTNPSSPEVPFAQLFISSLDAKYATKKNGLTFSSPFTSPRYVATNDLQAAYQLYPGSPAGNLLSPTSGVSGSGASSPFLDLEFPAQWSVSNSIQDALFPKPEPSKMFSLDRKASRTFVLSQDSDVSCFGTSTGFRLDQVKWTYHSHSQLGGEKCKSAPEAEVCCSSGENMQQKREKGMDTPASTKGEAGKAGSIKSETEQLEANRASFGLSADEVTSAGGGFSKVLGDTLSETHLRAQKSYAGEFATAEKSGGKGEMQTSQLELLDPGSNYSSIDCPVQGMESQVRKDTGNGSIDSVALDGSFMPVNCFFEIDGGHSQVSGQGISETSDHFEYQHASLEANNSHSLFTSSPKYSVDSVVKERVISHNSKVCAQTDERVHSKCGEFKFYKRDITVDSSMNREWWSKQNEKGVAESGVQNWEFFHMMQPGEELQPGRPQSLA
eukprot:Gb_09977 [translate_table: standard]